MICTDGLFDAFGQILASSIGFKASQACGSSVKPSDAIRCPPWAMWVTGLLSLSAMSRVSSGGTWVSSSETMQCLGIWILRRMSNSGAAPLM